MMHRRKRAHQATLKMRALSQLIAKNKEEENGFNDERLQALQ